MDTIVLGGGCFWCLDAGFKLIDGVEEVISGYAGGTAADANYHKVGTGISGHAEVVKVSFNSSNISLDEILDIFWVLHDPTTLNQQGNDVGPQYRSVIFYTDERQKEIAAASIEKVKTLWEKPVVTQLAQLEEFYAAEEPHQNYYANNSDAGYCQVIINPKLNKLRQKFSEKIKT